MKRILNNLSSKQIFILTFIFLMLVVFGRFFSLITFPDSSIVLSKGELISLKPDQTLNQTLVANRENLEQIDFLLRAPGITPPDKVEASIYDENCEALLRQGILKKSILDSENLYQFKFQKISDSFGKIYCIGLKYKKENGKSKEVRFFSMQNSDSRQTLKNVSTNEEFSDKKLSFRPSYSNDHFWQNGEELSKRISQYKPWFLKHYFLDAYVTLFLFLSVLIVILLIIL